MTPPPVELTPSDPPPPDKQRWKNVQLSRLPRLDWAEGERSASLEALIDWALDQMEEAADWYAREKRKVRRWARGIRGTAIIVAGLAAAIPALATTTIPGLEQTVHPSLATALGVLAGTLLLLDKFYGFTSSWMRYVTAYLRIKSLSDELQLTVGRERMAWKGGRPSHGQTVRLYDRVHHDIQQLAALIHADTAAWAQELQAALRELDSSIPPPTTALRGGINVVVSNGEQCDGAWSLEVDGEQRDCRGRSAAVSDLAPGLHRVAVTATIAGARVAAEHLVPVASSTVSTAELTLAGSAPPAGATPSTSS